jgi:hypothetical protein
MGSKGPVGLDYIAVKQAAGDLEIPWNKEMLLKIRLLEEDFLRRVYKLGRVMQGNKRCRHPSACAVCRKTCEQRLSS